MSAEHEPQATVRAAGKMLRLIERAADQAAAVIRERALGRATLVWNEKGPSDFVTEVDTAAENVIRDSLLSAEPGSAFIAEESAPSAQVGADVTFVVDPLDGTTNFLHGYPEYAVSICALLVGAPMAAVVLNVPRGDRYTAIAGGGARLDGTTIKVSQVRDPRRALVGTGFPFKQLRMLDLYQLQFTAITRGASGIRRAGSAALDLANVAAGRFDAFWELELAPWDFAAGALLIREAGGTITDWSGSYPSYVHSPIVAGNPAMHAHFMELLGELGSA
ncbi:MAG: inositol monophosphatase [Gemmatimonadaceae bacterium]